MGKRKKKNRILNQHQPIHHAQPIAPAATATTVKPVEVRETGVYQAHQAEYRAISSDLVRVVIINGIFLVAVLALYYIDKTNPFLKELFARIL